MKLVLISLARRGGMVHFLAELANALTPAASTAVVVSTLVNYRYFDKGISRTGVNTGTGTLQRLVQSVNPLTWLALFRHLSRLNADIVHIVGAHQWNPVLAVIVKLLRKPLVYTVHDPEAHPGSPWMIRAGDWATAKLADHVVVLNRYGRRLLLERGFGKDAVSIIPHPMYTLFRRWRPRKGAPKKVILHFGRIETYKGVEVLVEAFVSHREAMPGWKLLIAGSGPLKAPLLGMRAAGIQILNRYMADREVARLMHTAAFVALPYTSATQSGVIALAQAFGRPVIATSVGGLTEMVSNGKTGIVVPPNDVTALGRAMVSLTRDHKKLARMQRTVSTVAAATCSPQVIARAHLHMYRALIGQQ